jgi:hypothetical protein
LGLKKKKIMRRKVTIKDVERRINKAIYFLQHKRGSKEYIKLDKDIKASGIEISPETFQSLRIIVSVFASILTVLFKFLLYLNKAANIEVLNIASEMLNDPRITNIEPDINISTF